MAPDSAWVRAKILPIGLAIVCLIAVGAMGFWLREPSSADPAAILSEVDIGFAQDMSVHHEQAVLLARTLPTDASPPIRVVADRILFAQTAEIAQMRGWLQLFDLPVTVAEPMRWMGHDGHHTDGHGPSMPGMASTAEISRLAGLRGTEAEILFLQLMIRHHTGGVEMAQAGFNTGSAPAVKRVALDMVNEQGNEIGQMTALLTARRAEPLPFP